MKKVISILMLLTMLLGLCACGEGGTGGTTEPADPLAGVFSVGYGKADITPEESVPLGSYGNEEDRFHTGLLDYIYAITVALTDAEGNTLLLITTDLSWGNEKLNKTIRDAVTKKYDFIPADHVIVGGTHNHNAPSYGYSDITITRYLALWEERVMESIEQALNDRKPAKMHIATTETENLTFVRRYWLQNGNLKGDNWNDYDYSPIVGHETEADEQMQLVKFTREGGKDVMIVNWQSHANYVGATKDLSSDWVGPLRDKVEKELDCLVTYHQGAAGNLNPKSRIEGETQSKDQKEHGQLVADYVIAAKDSFVEVQTGKIQTTQMRFVGTVNHTEDHLVGIAKQIYAAYQSGTSAQKCAEMGAPYGINNWRNANSIISRSNQGQTRDMELNVLSIGDVAFVTMPAEFFDTTGMQIKTQSPFEMTVIMGYTCGDGTYLPTAEGFANKGYESFNCFYVSGTAELCVTEYLRMLNEQFASK